jgi:M6 family metalloprotease-like protein
MKTLLITTVLIALVGLATLPATAMPIWPKALEKAEREGVPLSDGLFAPPPPQVDAPGPIPPLGHSGAYKALLICIEFSDSGYTYSTTSFNNMAFGPWTTGSINDYYTEISYGNLTLSGNVYGWYTAGQGRDYYGNGQKGWGSYPQNTAKLVEEAVDAAEMSGCDFSLYDNDGDGQVESMFIVHSGEGCETSLNTNDIQSHKSKISLMGGTARSYDGVTVDTYVCVPELQSKSPVQHVEIGVYCHEYGHALGLPDLYDVGRYCTGTMGWGIGAWGLMSFGGWGGDVVSPDSPSHMCAWSKIKMGWIMSWPICNANSGAVGTLFRLENYPHVFKLGADMQNTEYFLVEMRDSAYGFDRSLVKRGVLIYHVDDDQYMENDCENGTGCTSNYNLMLALEQPDNAYDLDCGATGNYADRGDMYPYGSVEFSPTSSPSSDVNEGFSSGVTVKNFVVASNGLFADVYTQNPACHPQCVYDDGYYDIAYSWGAANSGFAVKCTPARYPAQVRGLRIMSGSSSFPDFQWRIWDDTGAGGTPGSPLTPLHTTSGASAYEWTYCNALGDTAVVDSGSFWAVYIEYNNSQILSDNSSTWSGRTMYYYLGNFSPDNGASGNYMIRAVYDTLFCAGVTGTPAPSVVASVSPNPFTKEVRLSFDLDRPGRVAIAIYDVAGRRVKAVADRTFGAGPHSLVWDGTDARGERVNAGIYFYRFTAGDGAHTGKLTVLR